MTAARRSIRMTCVTQYITNSSFDRYPSVKLTAKRSASQTTTAERYATKRGNRSHTPRHQAMPHTNPSTVKTTIILVRSVDVKCMDSGQHHNTRSAKLVPLPRQKIGMVISAENWKRLRVASFF